MSFWRSLPIQILKAIFTRSAFSWVRRSYSQSLRNGPRLSQFRLAIGELSFLMTVLGVAVLAWFLNHQTSWTQALVEHIGGLDGNGNFISILSDNRLQGVLFGWMFGFLGVLLTTRLWVPLLATHWVLSSGLLGLNVGWGVWLGLLPGFWLLQTLKAKTGEFKRWLWWKTVLSFLVFAVVFIFSDELTRLLRSNWIEGDLLDLRTVQWYVSGMFTLCLGLVLSAVHFHIYFWLFYRKP